MRLSKTHGAWTAALIIVVVVEAFGILAFGGNWQTLVYALAGSALAVGCVIFGLRSPVAEPAQDHEQISPPVRAVEAEPDSDERRAVGYVLVARDRLSCDLAAHSSVIRGWSQGHGVELAAIVHDVEANGGDHGVRPALRGALERISAGEAQTLVVAVLGHLTCTVASMSPLLHSLSVDGRSLVALDMGLDTGTADGRLAACALARVGEWERDRLSARTRRGLEAARARGAQRSREAVGDVEELRDRVAHMREAGMTLQAIADVLNEEGVPTLRGGTKWRPSSVQGATGYRRPQSRRPGMDLPYPGSENDPPASAA